MSSNNSIVPNNPVPDANAPVAPAASLPSGSSTQQDKESDIRTDRLAAETKRPRFAARPQVPQTRITLSGPEYETLIFKSAANHPLTECSYPVISTYVPNTTTLFVIINYMDVLMTSTDKWIRNCNGWVPPISSIYFSVLVYMQIIRAMISAGDCPRELLSLYQDFARLYPLQDLWIPGPLVSAFRALSAFHPENSDRFGSVTPKLPCSPGLTEDNNYQFDANFSQHLPNINLHLSRYHRLTNLARAIANEEQFLLGADSPGYISSLCRVTVEDDEEGRSLLGSPGLNLTLPGSLNLWRAASTSKPRLGLPPALNADTPDPINDTWSAALRMEEDDPQWFGSVAALMAKYAQFWKGSVSLNDCVPSASAAGAVRCLPTPRTNVFDDLPYTAPAGDGLGVARTADNHSSFFALNSTPRIVFNATCTVPDIPQAHIYSALTFPFNFHLDRDNQNMNCIGPFWTLAPLTYEGFNIETLPGILPTIMREYHSDNRSIQ